MSSLDAPIDLLGLFTDASRVRLLALLSREELTVAQVKEGSEGWNRPMLEAALTYEQSNAKRKGAIAALESALAAKEESK